MSPGNQILALTATSASANNRTIRAGNSVDRKKGNAQELMRAFCSPWRRSRRTDSTETQSPPHADPCWCSKNPPVPISPPNSTPQANRKRFTIPENVSIGVTSSCRRSWRQPGPGGRTRLTNSASTASDSGGVTSITPTQTTAVTAVMTASRMP